MSLLKRIGFGWTVWKLAAKRFGPLGGLVVAVAVVVGYSYLRQKLQELLLD